MKKYIPYFFGALAFELPAFVLAANSSVTTLEALTNSALLIVNKLVPITFTLALVFFFYGIAKFVLSAGNETARENSKGILLWGVIALAVMASIWGIVVFLQTLFGISGDLKNPRSLPVPTVGSVNTSTQNSSAAACTSYCAAQGGANTTGSYANGICTCTN